MDKTLKKLKPAALNFLRSRYTENEARNRWLKVERLYNKWLCEEGDLGGRANMMSSNLMHCYAMCAFYEAVDRNFNSEDFGILFNEVMAKKFVMLEKIDMNKYDRKKRLMNLLYRFVDGYKKKADKYRGGKWGNTWKIRLNPAKHETGFSLVFDSCPLYEFAQKHGYMDLLPLMCASDQIVAQKFHAHLIRHSTLSDGDGKCEYWYVGDKSPEALNDKGSK